MSILQTLWSFSGYLIPFVVVLSIVVFFHELGHFLVGRWCGVKVEAFSIGFGPELFSFTDGKGTRWRLAAIPLGGYVKFYGDANAASMSSEEIEAAMSAEDRKISLFGQSVGKRAAIVAAGPIANFILALVIFTGLFWTSGKAELAPRIASVRPGEAAEKAGFQPGDLVISIDGQKIASWNELQRTVQASGGVSLNFVVERGNREVSLTVTPVRQDIETQFGSHRAGLLGVTAANSAENWKMKEFTFGQALGESIHETWYVIERTGSYIGGLFAGKESAAQISGPLRIAEVSGELAKISIAALINLAAILSISIGLLNLFPVPPLDGGHLLYFAVEALKGRPLSQRGQEMGMRIGLAMVLALMVFATFNDIVHVGPKLLRIFG